MKFNEANLADTFFLEGRQAYEDDRDVEDCPYPEGTDGELGWQKGFISFMSVPPGTLLVIGERKVGFAAS